MYMIVAVGRQPVTDSHPSAIRFTAGLSKAHPIDKGLGNFAPLLIRQLSLLCAQ